MNKNLYVGNLSQKVTEDDLRNNFSEAGAVASVSVIKDKFSGVSRGFGFVEMGDRRRAPRRRSRSSTGGDLDGKTITVNEARPKTESSGPRRDGGGRGPGGGGFRGGRGGAGGSGGRGRCYKQNRILYRVTSVT